MHIKSMLCIYGKPNNSCYCKEDPRMHSHINCGCLTRWRRSPYAFARTGSRKLKGEREIGERPSSIPPSFLALSAAALFPTSVSDNLSFHWEVRVCHDEAMEKKRGNLSHAYSVQFVSLRGTTVVVEVEVEGKPAGFLFFLHKAESLSAALLPSKQERSFPAYTKSWKTVSHMSFSPLFFKLPFPF